MEWLTNNNQKAPKSLISISPPPQKKLSILTQIYSIREIPLFLLRVYIIRTSRENQYMDKQRDISLDSLKGLLIILVVLGHLLGEFGQDSLSYYTRAYIYTFHMPLFVLISGYFTRIKSTISFYKGIVKILIPLVFFQIVSLCLAYIFFDEIPGLSSLITPYWTLWYLLSLIFWRFILQFTPKRLINKPILYIFITFVLSLLGGLIDNGRVLSISRTLCFYPYFIIGYYIKNLKKGYPIVCNFPKNLLYLLVLFPLVFIVIGWYPSNSYILVRS